MYKQLLPILITVVISSVLPNWMVLAQDENFNSKHKVSQEFRQQLSNAIIGYFELKNAIFAEDINLSVEKATLLGKEFSIIKSDQLTEKTQTQW
jgi:hypothetical protein